MNEIIGWTVIALIALIGPLLGVIGLQQTFSSRPLEERYSHGRGAGLVSGMDAIWSPTAQAAGEERDRERRASVPAPSPDKGPGRIMDENRIVIEIPGDDEGPAHPEG